MADAMADRRFSRTRLALLVAAETAGQLWPGIRLAGPFSVPDRLLAAPQPVLSGDGSAAATLYGGTFTLGGITVEAEGRSIFEAAAPVPHWERALHGFSWLADLAAAETALSAAHARALIEQWAALGSARAVSRRPDVAARRLMNWLAYAPFLLEGADPVFRRKFLRGISRQAARLRRDIRRMRLGLPRLNCAIALAEAGLCLPDAARYLNAGSERLARDLPDLVLPDGGPATRNPADLVGLARDLLPLAALFSERGLEAPRELAVALDRIFPMLRFFRHEDGTLALFNGMGATDFHLLGAVLDLDEAQGKPVLNGSFSGYQRLEAGRSLLIADTGAPPPLLLSGEAHAGTLSFELSSGAARLIVNCGAPGDGHAGRRMAARKTAAHSTVSVGEASSARFATGRMVNRVLGPLLREGPRTVTVQREDRPDGPLRASHDGYAARFGMIHERTLRLSPGGDRLDGLDVLRPTRQRTGADITLSFHLHPDIRATVLQDGRAVLLALPDGEIWLFSAEAYAAELEESIFFAGTGGPRRAEQIIVRLGRKAGARIAWSFARTAGQPPAALS